MTNNTQSDLLSKPPKTLYLAVLLCIMLGIFMTPDRMIALGPMRQSLLSDIDSVREIAYAEVFMARILFFVLALLLIGCVIKWRQIVNSALIQSINAHVPLVIDRPRNESPLFNKSLAIMLGCAALGISYIIFGARLFSSAQLEILNGEDGVIEYLTVLFFLICSVLSAILAFKFSGNRARVVVHGFLAFVFFIMVGEEISWGQRIFNVGTSEVFENINVQGEANIHNLFGYFSDHIFIATILLYGFVLSFLVYFNESLRKLFDKIGFPIASLGLALGFLMASMAQRWIIFRFIDPLPSFRIEEMRELLSAIALALLMVESLQLLPQKSKIPREVPQSTRNDSTDSLSHPEMSHRSS